MPDLPTCQCVQAQPPFDRLTSIYCALQNIVTNTAQLGAPLLVAVGDSNTGERSAPPSSANAPAWPTVFAANNPSWDVQNSAPPGGQNITAAIAAYGTQAGQYFAPLRRQNVLVVFIGSAELANGDSSASVLSSIATLVALGKQTGFQVVTVTIAASSLITAGAKETNRLAVNTALVANAGSIYGDAISNPSGDARWNSPAATSNATWYCTDTIHINPASQAVFEQFISATISILPTPSPWAPNFGTMAYQYANNVAITGGTAVLSQLNATTIIGGVGGLNQLTVGDVTGGFVSGGLRGTTFIMGELANQLFLSLPSTGMLVYGSAGGVRIATWWNGGGLSVGSVSAATNPGDGVVLADFLRLNSFTPASAAASGVADTIARDANFIYVCTATNTWKRVAIATW